MQKVIYLDQITDFATNMEPSIVAYIAEGLLKHMKALIHTALWHLTGKILQMKHLSHLKF